MKAALHAQISAAVLLAAGPMLGCGGPSSTGEPPAATDGGCGQTMDLPPHGARSAGFAGTDAQYFALYGLSCTTASDCVAPCIAAGGSMASCASGSACAAGVADGGMGCLPPTYWTTAEGALSDSNTTMNAATLVLVDDPYDDALIMSDFRTAVPASARITGIEFKVRRNADLGFAVDSSVRVLQNGVPVGVDHAQPAAWPQALDYATYGGPTDTWGLSWTAADIASQGFGISVAPRYTSTAGNDRVHIDSVRATVFYSGHCD